jgi:hypothetical protein
MEPYFPGKTGKQQIKEKKHPTKECFSHSDAPEVAATPSRNLKAQERAHHVPENSEIATPPAQEQEAPVSEPSESLDTVGENTKTTFAEYSHTEDRQTTNPTGNGFSER